MKEIELENNAFLISKTDKSGIITYSNIPFQMATGYTEKDIIGKSYKFFVGKETPDLVIQDLWEKVTSGKSWQGIIKINCIEKNFFWVDSLISPSYMEDEMIGFLLIKRKATKNQIEEALIRYKEIQRNK
jgi:methyl-accepting chemotaxis protein/aerotaxis receptor